MGIKEKELWDDHWWKINKWGKANSSKQIIAGSYPRFGRANIKI